MDRYGLPSTSYGHLFKFRCNHQNSTVLTRLENDLEVTRDEYDRTRISSPRAPTLCMESFAPWRLFSSQEDVENSMSTLNWSLPPPASPPIYTTRAGVDVPYGIQFYPEVAHTPRGKQIIPRFLLNGCNRTMFIVKEIAQVWDICETKGRVIGAVSGGVDNTVTAELMHEAIGGRYVQSSLTPLCSTVMTGFWS